MSSNGDSAGNLSLDLVKKVRSLVQGESGSDDIAGDELATSTKLQSWEDAQLPKGWKFSSRLPITLVLLFLVVLIFVPWTQTVTVTGQISP
jgi:hypothetical protein